ncbi:MAG: glycosyltransferase family 10 domain-containing protein [Blastocatellia bacterium]
MLILFYSQIYNMIDPASAPPGFEYTFDRRRLAEAGLVVFHVPEIIHWSMRRLSWLGRYYLPAKRPGQLWASYSMECAENYPLMRNLSFLRRMDIVMSYHLDADIPLLYAGGDDATADLERKLRQPPGPKQLATPVASFVSSRVNQSGRRAYIRELMRHVPVDSWGGFMRNRTLAEDRGAVTKLETIARYKFTLAFENARDVDYVTEKFYDPLVAGSVPVYLGAPNIEDFAPGDHCFINAADFPDPAGLAAYLRRLAHDEPAYEAFFAWKQKPWRAGFRKILDLGAVNTLWRMCEMAEEMAGARHAAPRRRPDTRSCA